jgi:hypothetical protein
MHFLAELFDLAMVYFEMEWTNDKGPYSVYLQLAEVVRTWENEQKYFDLRLAIAQSLANNM